LRESTTSNLHASYVSSVISCRSSGSMSHEM
jgi:hypothetical protein